MYAAAIDRAIAVMSGSYRWPIAVRSALVAHAARSASAPRRCGSLRSASVMKVSWVGTVMPSTMVSACACASAMRGGVASEREAHARFDQIEHRRLLVHFRDLDRLHARPRRNSATTAGYARTRAASRSTATRRAQRQSRAPFDAVFPAGRRQHAILELRERDRVKRGAVARFVLGRHRRCNSRHPARPRVSAPAPSPTCRAATPFRCAARSPPAARKSRPGAETSGRESCRSAAVHALRDAAIARRAARRSPRRVRARRAAAAPGRRASATVRATSA